MRVVPDAGSPSHATWQFLRANPQVLVLLVICLVLGIGAFLAVVLGVFAAGSTTTNGEPSGIITGMLSIL